MEDMVKDRPALLGYAEGPMTLEPIVHEYDLGCRPEEAFDAYANHIGEWWHPNYTANPETFETVSIEPRVGGRVYESHKGGDELDWGRVTVWEPGRRLVYSSRLALPPDHSSEITVRFTAEGRGCRVRFEHGGWNERSAASRAKFSDWRIILDRFAARANRSPGA
jgi:hypothetical protein